MVATPPPIPDGYEVARTLLDPEGIASRVVEMADTMGSALGEELQDVVLVGIRRGGVHLAERLAALLGARDRPIPVGVLDISLYRDDLNQVGPNPIVGPTSIPCGIDGVTVVLVDDVLYTGRTIRAALDALIDYGRPSRVLLGVLVDRGHRELPIQPDFCGLDVDSTSTEQVEVRWREEGGDDTALLLSRKAPGSPGVRGA